MLRHVGLTEDADKVEKAVRDVLSEGKIITGDLGGTATTEEFTNAVIARLKGKERVNGSRGSKLSFPVGGEA